jgi:ring-1,2-phenylacetyl-CoA epoxidase subunit PaaD
MVSVVETARQVAASVTDPELPMLTLADLGVLRAVAVEDGRVVVAITPTYSGCPAMDAMRDDLDHALRAAGFADVEIRVVLSPAWSSDWITERGRRALVAAGIAPPGPARQGAGPVPLTLGAARPGVVCPLCGSRDTREVSRFGATACRSLWRCRSCTEPFEYVKEL